jgi:hypothetical protein
MHEGLRGTGRSSMRLSLVAGLLLPTILFGQNLQRLDVTRLAEALVCSSTDAALCLDDSAVAVSNRLGVSYDGVRYKCLISYDFDDSVKCRLKNKQIELSASLASCGDDYQRLTVAVPSITLSRVMYLRRGRFTSPFFYLTHGWKSSSSRFFRFVFEDSTLTNPYAVESLDRCVLYVGGLLGFSTEDFSILANQKVLYFLCRDEAQIQWLTGFRTRGMYNLAYDAIVTTYNAHLHELIHLLVNFKLRHVKLFANPFLQEGLAVALGGRGGLSAEVVMQLGAYLEESQMLQYNGMLRRSEFALLDASLSYPVAGLYNRFLLQTLGAEKYLALYRTHCGSPGDSCVETIAASELPASPEWRSFQREVRSESVIEFGHPSGNARTLWLSSNSSVTEDGGRYHFAIQKYLFFGRCDTSHTWYSNKFLELFPGYQNPGHRYAALADSQTVSIYDLWTNTLIGSYVASLDVSPRAIPSDGGKYIFSVPKSLLSGELAVESTQPRDSLDK